MYHLIPPRSRGSINRCNKSSITRIPQLETMLCLISCFSSAKGFDQGIVNSRNNISELIGIGALLYRHAVNRPRHDSAGKVGSSNSVTVRGRGGNRRELHCRAGKKKEKTILIEGDGGTCERGRGAFHGTPHGVGCSSRDARAICILGDLWAPAATAVRFASTTHAARYRCGVGAAPLSRQRCCPAGVKAVQAQFALVHRPMIKKSESISIRSPLLSRFLSLDCNLIVLSPALVNLVICCECTC